MPCRHGWSSIHPYSPLSLPLNRLASHEELPENNEKETVRQLIVCAARLFLIGVSSVQPACPFRIPPISDASSNCGCPSSNAFKR